MAWLNQKANSPSGPPTELGRLRVLSPTAAIRVSPLALGGGNIGQAWNQTWGLQTKERAFELLDAYLAAGGNFIDTSNTYQDGQSETWIGEWLSLRGPSTRDRVVLATKYTSDFDVLNSHHPDRKKGQFANCAGNSRRSLHTSVRNSLERLQTDWIDILYVHWWDYTASIEEVIDSLNILVQQGKVLYLGVSDTPAWIVSAANTYAKAHGKVGFSVYSGKWSVLARDVEREILPMCRAFGMALVPWGTLGSGFLQSKKQMEEREKQGEGLRAWGRGREVEMSDALERVGAEHGVESVTCVALAYVLAKAKRFGVHCVYPVIGGRKVEQLMENIQALSLELTDEQIKALESIREFDLGFPHNFIGRDPNMTGVLGDLTAQTVYLSFPATTRK
ncbi:NADP-dependent oxidoreductase domain-containing protein [Apiosordaria backusii]|uniref:NADP-dependent oxidoreductase domain-containing protein n=1 Tax=Apiosordaria backusii TaxID=314023 RepID=A0AA40BS98_9PEZI|nr:NADP-dependent oxidoreductase domain-containing protein [Apiosordaria backusii]